MIEKERGPGLLYPDRGGNVLCHGLAASMYADMCEKISSTLGVFSDRIVSFGSAEHSSRPCRTVSICDKI
jgi:hypothetical protein